MAHIIAGHLQQQEQVQEAIDQLVEAGFAKEKSVRFMSIRQASMIAFRLEAIRTCHPAQRKALKAWRPAWSPEE
jgi:hypothetical protein